jgi:hypothetical protein
MTPAKDDNAAPAAGSQLSAGIDLYGILQAAAQDAVGAGSSDAIYDRMTSFIDRRLSSQLSNYNFFLSLTTGNNGGAGGWCRDSGPFGGQTMWGGGAGILPGIGAQYGVACTVVWG